MSLENALDIALIMKKEATLDEAYMVDASVLVEMSTVNFLAFHRLQRKPS